jgi:hypothetical protein
MNETFSPLNLVSNIFDIETCSELTEFRYMKRSRICQTCNMMFTRA